LVCNNRAFCAPSCRPANEATATPRSRVRRVPLAAFAAAPVAMEGEKMWVCFMRLQTRAPGMLPKQHRNELKSGYSSLRTNEPRRCVGMLRTLSNSAPFGIDGPRWRETASVSHSRRSTLTTLSERSGSSGTIKRKPGGQEVRARRSATVFAANGMPGPISTFMR
jgi:hypothetical protein